MIYGICSGMVMQRDKGDMCHVRFESDREIGGALCLNDDQALTVEKEDGAYVLGGLLVGGPYSLDIGGERFDDIYVGDVWLLAGQSNMQGVGRVDSGVPHNDNPAVRAFYMYGKWDIANHPLHELSRAIHKVHTVKLNQNNRFSHGTRLVGSGVAFARRMFELTGVPQGVIACAHGGTSMQQWDPAQKELGSGESLYAAMLERFRMNGSHVKGMFWYQGCSDTGDQSEPLFTARMKDFVSAVRADMGTDLPVVQVQIGRVSCSPLADDAWRGWTGIREQQRLLNGQIDRLDTVHTVGLELADNIHIEGGAQEKLGEKAAESMLCLLHGPQYGCQPGITLKSVEIFPDDMLPDMATIVLTYDHVHGQLDGGSRPLGYSFSTSEAAGFFRPFQCRVDGNRVLLKVQVNLKELPDCYLWYGLGRDPDCNILDGRGNSLPGFGPLKLG